MLSSFKNDKQQNLLFIFYHFQEIFISIKFINNLFNKSYVSDYVILLTVFSKTMIKQ